MRYIGGKKKPAKDPRMLIGGILLFLTALIVILGFMWLFGGKSEKTKPDETVQIMLEKNTDDIAPEQETQSQGIHALSVLNEPAEIKEANLRGLHGHPVKGILQIKTTFAEYEATIVASLPAIDGSMHRYEAWALQPGLADYFSLGTLSVRADGWYALSLKESIINIPERAETYNHIIITRESLNTTHYPSNIRIAEGFFDL